MTTLREIRAALTTALAPVGAPVLGDLPARFTPPIAVLVPGSPYVESGELFGSYKVRHTVVLIVGGGSTVAASERLDGLIAQALAAVVESDGFYLESIDQPALYQHVGTEFLSCAINVYATERVEG